jgi:hypothetical protein
MALLDDKLELDRDDEAYKNTIVQAFAIMSEYPVLRKQVKLIGQLDGGHSMATCYKIVRDAQYIFGNIHVTNRLYLKNAQRERLLKIIEKLRKAPKIDYTLILKAEELLMKLDDLPKALPGAEKSEEEVYVIPPVEFTSDPMALIEEAHVDEEE